MDFRTASEIAKQHPDAIITRDEAGEFVVQLRDGTRIRNSCAANGGRSPSETSQRQTIHKLETENQELRVALDSARSRHRRLRDNHANLEAELSSLKARLAKVSDAEWRRIDHAEQRAAEQARTAQRDQLMKLVRAGTLDRMQLLRIRDSATELDLSPAQIREIDTAIARLPTPWRGPLPDSDTLRALAEG